MVATRPAIHSLIMTPLIREGTFFLPNVQNHKLNLS